MTQQIQDQIRDLEIVAGAIQAALSQSISKLPLQISIASNNVDELTADPGWLSSFDAIEAVQGEKYVVDHANADPDLDMCVRLTISSDTDVSVSVTSSSGTQNWARVRNDVLETPPIAPNSAGVVTVTVTVTVDGKEWTRTICILLGPDNSERKELADIISSVAEKPEPQPGPIDIPNPFIRVSDTLVLTLGQFALIQLVADKAEQLSRAVQGAALQPRVARGRRLRTAAQSVQAAPDKLRRAKRSDTAPERAAR